MFTATYMIYNGIHSASYGLRIASFDNESLEETTISSPNISTSKSKYMNRFVITNVQEDATPEVEMTLVSEVLIDELTRRKIITWLRGGKDFQKMIVERPNCEDVYYMCKFRDIRELKVNGHCVGFKMTAVFDSPFQYGIDTTAELKDDNYDNKIVRIMNRSDFTDEYVYPQVSFKLSSGNSIKIINLSDDTQREFVMSNLPTGVQITIDNELKIIYGEGVTLANFNKNWLRLVKGKNRLKVTLQGELQISCPQIVSTGF